MPLVMPPIKSTGVMIGSTALKRKNGLKQQQQHGGEERRRRAGAELGRAPDRGGKATTMASSSRALPILDQLKATSRPQLFLCA